MCGSGLCTPLCTLSGQCPSSRTCCSGRCVDTTFDEAHCGACDAGCGPDAFCGRSACRDAVLANFCEAGAAAAVVLNDEPVDDDAGTAMGAAVAATCAPPPAMRLVHQLDGGLVDPVTGRPRVGGELLVVGGGSFRQKVVDWLENNRLAPVNDTSTATDISFTVRDGGVVLTGLRSTLNPGHDYVVVQLVRTPNGTTAVVAFGIFGPGTQAASWYFVNRVAPQRSTFIEGWYLLEWTDANGDFLPDPGDTWTLRGSGR